MSTCFCPGSFDPVTNGHLDILTRASAQFDRTVVGVMDNPRKQSLFSIEERVGFLARVLPESIEVVTFDGLTTDACKAVGATCVIRGIRTVSDYDFEEQMAQMNARMGVETAFLICNPAYAFLSASLIKEVVRYGGEVTGLVPDFVASALAERLTGKD